MTDKLLTGTVVNYYFHCKRQCWLFANLLNLEDNSEDVRIGKVLHELKSQAKEELSIDSIKLDKITADYVVEMKKSDADLSAAKAQLIYYLVVLQDKGVVRKGQLVCLEKGNQTKSSYVIDLAEEDMQLLRQTYVEIAMFIHTPTPPAPILVQKCKKCAYYEYCFI